jgi:acyl CoA:acetate/3-ketoacid CoA transferase beta subunit
MHLASGVRRLIVTMIHTNLDGSAKKVSECTLPLAARGVIGTIITDLSAVS